MHINESRVRGLELPRGNLCCSDSLDTGAYRDRLARLVSNQISHCTIRAAENRLSPVVESSDVLVALRETPIDIARFPEIEDTIALYRERNAEPKKTTPASVDLDQNVSMPYPISQLLQAIDRDIYLAFTEAASHVALKRDADAHSLTAEDALGAYDVLGIPVRSFQGFLTPDEIQKRKKEEARREWQHSLTNEVPPYWK